MKNSSKIFTVIVGDLIRSRAIKNRPIVSRKINSALRKASGAFAGQFTAPLQLTKGIDEFSGVLKNPSESYRICRYLNNEIFPELFRFSIANGVLDIGVTSRDARKMDGTAFHIAAKNLNRIKRLNYIYIFKIRAEYDPWLNQIANLCSLIESGWSFHQHEVFTLYESFKKQDMVATRLDISQQAVSDALQAANYKAMMASYSLIDSFLKSSLNTSKKACL